MSDAPDSNDLLRRRGAEALRQAIDDGGLEMIPEADDGGKVVPIRQHDVDVRPLALTRASDLAGTEPDAHVDQIEDMAPAGELTLLSGGAGHGKSLVLQQAIVATSIGAPWLGKATRRGPALGVFCEDKASVLHRRAISIANSYGASLTDLPDAHWQSRAGLDNTLATFSPRGTLEPAALFRQIEATADALRPVLIVLDNVAQLMRGSEIDRSSVTQFCNLLTGLAVQTDAAVILAAHPAKVDGSEYSGSTAWDAAVRSRLFLTVPKAGADVADLPDHYHDQRILRRSKSNYARRGEEIALRWQDGVFVPEGQPDSVDRISLAAKADRVFLALTAKLYGQGVWVSPSPTARNYAPAILAKDTDREELPKQHLEAAMHRLMKAGEVRTERYGRPSDPRSRLAPA
jgi:RecA-family ATPase